jgi:hypothetical protein
MMTRGGDLSLPFSSVAPNAQNRVVNEDRTYIRFDASVSHLARGDFTPPQRLILVSEICRTVSAWRLTYLSDDQSADIFIGMPPACPFWGPGPGAESSKGPDIPGLDIQSSAAVRIAVSVTEFPVAVSPIQRIQVMGDMGWKLYFCQRSEIIILAE